ncbi:triphosphoribosyl-dephospho-CoA synthase [Reyranella sp.]|uniref:triphosphoribosyl-dephospho-CoA synthase n=1 Tax=Reyranella sp. TaxID=1929291 RepID=UPI003F71E010
MSPEDQALARAAVAAMRDELQAYPKPGLVSPVDSGAHDDMDFGLMCRSADSLLEPFVALATAGRAARRFEDSLMPIGIEAERGMLAVTGGVNTHRGAIFSVVRMVAALARAQALPVELTPTAVRDVLQDTWGASLAAHAARDGATSHGAEVRRRTGRDGARREAALAFPSVFETGVPAYRAARQAGLDDNAASIETLFTLMAAVDDTTVLYRGGLEAGSFVRQAAAGFLADGGCRGNGWFEKAQALHRNFVERNLSAGGCADLLACTLLVSRSCGESQPQPASARSRLSGPR